MAVTHTVRQALQGDPATAIVIDLNTTQAACLVRLANEHGIGVAHLHGQGRRIRPLPMLE
ncbi:hypothetical protein D3C81_1121010 [compost metagenome]